MATLQRLTGKVFAGKASLTDLGVFGSALSGTPTNPTAVNTDAQIQSDSAYENGWTDAVITTKNFPPIEEVNGVLRTISHQACYLLQAGIPTWDANTAYDLTSIVKVVNGSELILYHPIQLDSNNECKGHAVNETAWWEKVIITGDREIGVPQITLDFSGPLPANCIDLVGQEESKTGVYSGLYAIYGDTYNQGDEASGNFRFPDFRGRAIYGGTSAGWISAGLPELNLQTVSNGYHDHGASSTSAPNHNHSYKLTSSNRDYGDGKPSSLEQKYFVTSISNSNSTTGNAGSWTPSITVNKNGSHTHTITHNGIIGSADSVYTKGIKVRVFTRYQ